MAETGGVGVTRVSVPRDLEARLARVIALLLATVVASAVAALATAHATTAAAGVVPTGRLHIQAVDAVSPMPIDLTSPKPQPPGRGRARPGSRQVAATPPTDPAPGPLSGSCAGAGWQQRRGAAALGSLLHPLPTGVTLSFLPGGGALKGMTFYDSHHVDVYVAACDMESGGLLRHVIAHELGHAWDSLRMNGGLRARYLAARGIPAGTPWFGCDRCQDFATPAGDFAETYAQWQRGASDSRSQLAPPASPAELAQLGPSFFR